jgi:hypothetical protein
MEHLQFHVSRESDSDADKDDQSVDNEKDELADRSDELVKDQNNAKGLYTMLRCYAMIDVTIF